ncbi:uncharacterized protein LOC62_06G008160 [Vanrija pseudolonga]|uniref:Uncharacterized protein n=1 Tax=Vanrija pseudolonga TaxID=143232 RepID=A0AAF1BKH2_9TREE|nr:hypothetical protein LOC62_06G008160 [Vanrija pseudolonga]
MSPPPDVAGPSTAAGPSNAGPAPYATIEAEWRAAAFAYAPEYRDCLLGAVCVGIVDPRGAPPTLRSSLTALPVHSHTAIVGLLDDLDADDDAPTPPPAKPILRAAPRRVTFSEPAVPRRAPPPVPLDLQSSFRSPEKRQHPASAFDPASSARPASMVDSAAATSTSPPTTTTATRPGLSHRPLSWADAATVAKWPWGARRGSGASTPTSPVGPVTPTAGVFVSEGEEEEGKGKDGGKTGGKGDGGGKEAA